MKTRLALFFFVLPSLVVPDTRLMAATPPDQWPLVHIHHFVYQGGFRVPQATYQESSMNTAQGPIEYNPANHSLFMVGHNHQQAIAEFKIPEIINSTTVTALKMAEPPIQGFWSIIDRASNNTQSVNTIGGLKLVSGPAGPQLLVNCYEYYDAAANNTNTTLVIRSPAALETSPIDGFYDMAGAAHLAGWMSEIPADWISFLGAKSHIAGNSSGVPIISRASVGPSAFSFDPQAFMGAAVSNPISTTKLLDFSLSKPLHGDLFNLTLLNDLWSHLSRATYGFIPPGTRTYVTIGSSGGHLSGVCYKGVQNNGALSGGYSSSDATDNYPYYWLWDVNDLVAVKEGRKNAYDIRPYEYGYFPNPFKISDIGGGAYDPVSGNLYLTAQAADRDQGRYSNPPVVMVYKIDNSVLLPAPLPPASPKNLKVQ